MYTAITSLVEGRPNRSGDHGRSEGGACGLRLATSALGSSGTPPLGITTERREPCWKGRPAKSRDA